MAETRYAGWRHTFRRLWWLVGKAPRDCERCGQLYVHELHPLTRMAPPGYFEKTGACGWCGQQLPE